MTHADILQALGVDAVAKATGRLKPTVQSWLARASIPPDEWANIASMPGARKAQATLTNLAATVKRRRK